MKKSWKVSLVCAALLIAAVIGFTVKSAGGDKSPQIVVVLEDLDSEYWKTIEAGAKKAFDDFHINGKVLAPNSKYPTRVELLQGVLEQKPDALIAVPIAITELIPVLQEYKERHIPVLFVDTDAHWTNKTAYVGTNNRMLGKKAGELLASMLQPGEKAALFWDHSANGFERYNGAKEALEAAGNNVITQNLDVGDMDRARSEIRSILDQNANSIYSEVKGVFAIYDGLALEIMNIAEEKGLKIPVVGADGIQDMVKAVDEGTLSATVAQNPYDMGYQSVENAVKAIQGEAVDKMIDSGVDIITKDNAKEKLEFITQILNQD